jgi:ApaG protein
VSNGSNELTGLSASLERLAYHHGGASLPPDKPHAFVYFVTIRNGSGRAVTLLGRKWVIEYVDGNHEVIEGDRIVGEVPRLSPGDSFSYNSYHVTGLNARVQGSFHGVDEFGGKVHVLMAPFDLVIPFSGSSSAGSPPSES